jgi:NAD(P)-dependent dehydrogenase (short-subunit alcohol dehydrogenase family)
LLATKAAISAMKEQSQKGFIFLMEGGGSSGMATPKYITYGVSKAGMGQLMKSLNAELKELGLLPKISVHNLSPGMVITDLLVRPPPSPPPEPRSLRIFNILCERPSTVASWLVPRIRGVSKPGQSIQFLTPYGVAWRFVTARFRRNRFFEEKK